MCVQVWIPIGLFFFDRLTRACNVLYINLNVPQCLQKCGARSGLWATEAKFTSLPGNVTRVTINAAPNLRWTPGQHMFISCHSVVPLQSHPFTIASLPSDGNLEFLVQAKQGGTKRFFDHASKYQQLPVSKSCALPGAKVAALEGPYGRIRSLRQFDSVILFAGSTGAAFTVPLMRDIVHRWCDENNAPDAVTRRIRFVWAIKSRDQLNWFQEQFEQVMKDTEDLRALDKEVEMSVYVTCDEELVAEKGRPGTCCRPPIHSTVEELSPRSSTKPGPEKKTFSPDDVIEVNSVTSTEIGSSNDTGCQADGACCCRSTVKDESNAPVCTCSIHNNAERPSIEQKSAPSFQDRKNTPPPPMKILSGRPHPRSIIRNALEEAEGESAVVVCGLVGLKDDVRDSVVALSDERAVHKGTGAQGIYLHVEGFDY